MGKGIEFNYDPILKAWTFDASLLREFVEKQAEGLDLADNEKNQWIED